VLRAVNRRDDVMQRVGFNIISIHCLMTIIQKLNRERAVWARLNHPNVIVLYGYTKAIEAFDPYGAFISPVSHILITMTGSLISSMVVSQWRCCEIS
jgi:hypothetical protein